MRLRFFILFILSVTGLSIAQMTGRSGFSGHAQFFPSGDGMTADSYCGIGDIANFGPADGPASLPNGCVYTALNGSPSSGSQIVATSTSQFTAALASASCGDTILLSAGVTYAGQFALPNKACDATHWITISSDMTGDPHFPAPGVRATPCEIGQTNDAIHNGGVRQNPGLPDYDCSSPAVRMPTINSGGANLSSIAFDDGANHYRLIGLNIQKLPGSAALGGKLVSIGEKNPLVRGASHIIIDRSLIHGEPWANLKTNQTQGGVGAQNSQYIAVVDSWIYDIFCITVCVDSQGYSAGTGPIEDGPHKLWNNVIASSGEAWLFGGGGVGVSTPNSHNFFGSHNHVLHPMTWMIPIGASATPPYDNAPIVKNNGETKNCVYCLVEFNFCERNWQGQSDQDGYCWLVTPKSNNNAIATSVNFNGSTTITAASGTPFLSSMADAANCPPLGCIIEINDSNRSDDGVRYRICNTANPCGHSGYISATQVELTSAPSAGSAVSVNACPPGDSPGSKVSNLTIRYNYMRLVSKGVQVVTGVSTHCADESQGADHISIHDVLAEGLSSHQGNGFDPDSSALFVFVGNGQEGAIINNVLVDHNTAIVAEGGSLGGFGVQVDHTDHHYMQSITYRDNIGNEGLHITHSNGSSVNGGVAVGLPTQGCNAVIPNELPDGFRTVFNLPSAVASYTVTKNGVPQTPSSHTTSQFTLSSAPNTGDIMTARDLGACTYTYTNNAIGAGLVGSGQDETPYPAGNFVTTDPTFSSQFANWQSAFGGDYRLCRTGTIGCSGDSTYASSASDAGSRTATGKGLGADVDTLLARLAGVYTSVYDPALSITTTSPLPAVTAGTAYSQQLAASTGASPYKEWSVTTGTMPTGLALSRAGYIGQFSILTVVRDGSGNSTVTVSESITGGAFVGGQSITVAGLVNGSGSKANDSTFNGTFTATSITGPNKINFSQVGQPTVTSHNPDKGGTAKQAPTTPGSYSFTVQARDGARQVATQAFTLQVN